MGLAMFLGGVVLLVCIPALILVILIKKHPDDAQELVG
jgi:hypothetical protein